tara:strand:- start:13476 stop:14591 length:1116 start_codon:yes stop_codon:yes gene_type:complete
LRFSYYLNPQTIEPEDDRQIINEMLNHTGYAIKNGFTDIWITDHNFTGYSAFSDAIIMAGAVTQRFPGTHIGFALNVVPLMHPIRFVTQMNLLDQLTNGNLTVGVGAGNSPSEFAGYGIDVDNRHEIMDEFMSICEKAWVHKKGELKYNGKYFNGRIQGRIIPQPVQEPYPHLAVGTGTPERLTFTGQKGWSLLMGPREPQYLAVRMHMYKKGLNNSNLNKKHIEKAWKYTGVGRQLYICEEGENWRESLAPNIDHWIRISARGDEGKYSLTQEEYDDRYNRYTNGGWLYAGTADEIFKKLEPLAKLGIRHLMCWFDFGMLSNDQVMGSLQRFIKHVMPRLTDVETDPIYIEKLLEDNSMETKAPDALNTL